MSIPKEPDQVMKQRGGSVLGKKTILKSDHFPGCQNKRLSPHIDGAPNYRQPRAHMRFWRLLPLKSFKKCFFSIEMGGMGKLEAVRRSICTDSEWRRRELIDYIQRIIKGRFGTEVLSFGSVPLKTYLPDGDIDLTVLCHRNKEEELARAVCSLLEGEPKEPGFLVKDVRYVYAKVDFLGDALI